MDGDVGHPDLFLFFACCLHAVVHHDVAERAGRGDTGGAGLDQLVGALIVDLLADRFFHPHAGATGSATHALGAVALGLDNLDATELSEHLAGCHVDIVVASEIARIVVDDALFEPSLGKIETALVDQPFE